MQPTRGVAFCLSLVRHYAPKYPRPRPGTSERPAYRPSDPLINNPKAAVKTFEEDNLTFIHRPPSTAPSPYSLTTAPASPLLRPAPSHVEPLPPLPPVLRQPPTKEHPQMSDEQIEKMRHLRFSNPTVYSRGKLAKMFNCTQAFVASMAALKKPQRKALIRIRDQRHEKYREKWSEKHALVKAIRAKRREMW
jgi:Mitochondrial ribosomal protein subunit L20